MKRAAAVVPLVNKRLELPMNKRCRKAALRYVNAL